MEKREKSEDIMTNTLQGPFYNLLTYHIAIIPNTIPSIGAPKERKKRGK